MALATLSLFSAPSSSSSSYSHADRIRRSWPKRRETRKTHLALNSTVSAEEEEEQQQQLGMGSRNGAQGPPSPATPPAPEEPKRNLHFLEERDEGLLSERLLKLSRSNKLTSATELHASMDALGLLPSAHARNSLLSCLLRNGPLDEALRAFGTMANSETASGHTYSLVLKAVARGRGPDAALHLFRTLEGGGASEKSFDIVVYNTMISISGRAKRWTEAERLWRKFKRNGLSGTMITYSLLISTFVRCGQTELAVDAYHELGERGLEPSEDIMKAVIASCTKEGDWATALNVFEKMLGSGVEPNMIAYNSLINCLGKAGEDELAFRIYENMKSSGRTPDLYTWSALLRSLYRSKRYADALQLFEGIKSEPGIRLNAHLYNTALMSCQKLGLWERSLQLLWQMEASGMEMSTVSYNHVICACEVARKPKVALQVYEHMTHLKLSPDTFTYLSLIRACVWGSLWTDVEKILEVLALLDSPYRLLFRYFMYQTNVTIPLFSSLSNSMLENVPPLLDLKRPAGFGYPHQISACVIALENDFCFSDLPSPVKGSENDMHR